MKNKKIKRFLALAAATALLISGICPESSFPVYAGEVSGEEAQVSEVFSAEDADAAESSFIDEDKDAILSETSLSSEISEDEEEQYIPENSVFNDTLENDSALTEDASSEMDFSAAGEDEENAGTFAFTVVTSDQVLIAPTMISYSAEDTIQDALTKSRYNFAFSTQSFLESIEGVSDNFSIYYDNGGYDLSAKASSITAMWICSNIEQSYSEEIFDLVKNLGQYSSSEDGCLDYTPLKTVYGRAVKSLYGATADSAEALNTELKAQYQAYEDYIHAGTVNVSLDLTNADGNTSAGKAVFTDAYGIVTSFENVSTAALRPGTYSYEISDSAYENRCIRGTLTVSAEDEKPAISAVFPEGDWISDIQIGIKTGYNKDTDAVACLQGENAWEKTYFVPDTAGTSLYPYITPEDGIDTSAIRPYLQGKDTNATNARSWKGSTTSLARCIQTGSLDETDLVIEARQSQGDYEQYTIYKLNIKRQPTLSSLKVSADGTLLPVDFAAAVTDYDLTTVSDTLEVNAMALCSGCDVQIEGKTPDAEGNVEINLSDLTQSEGTYLLSVNLKTADDVENSYRLHITKKDAVEVTLTHSAGVLVSVVNEADVNIAPVSSSSSASTFRLIPGDSYSWVSTIDSCYHASAAFTAAEGLRVETKAPKKTNALSSMSARSTSSVAAKNTVNFTLSPSFSASVHSYTIPVSSSLAAFYLQQLPVSTADYTSTAYFTNYKGVDMTKTLTSSASSASILANLIGVSGKSADVRVEVRQNTVEDGVSYYEDYTLKIVRQMQLNALTAADHEGASMVLFQSGSETSGFSGSVYNYTASIAKAAQTMTISPKLFSSVSAGDYDGKLTVSCGDFTKTITFDPETNSPADIQNIEIPLDTEAAEETVKICVSDADPDALTGTYTIELTKLPPIETSLRVTPENATVFLVNDLTGNRVLPDEKGKYQLNDTASYSCTVTAYGYVSRKFSFIAGEDTASQTITLEKAEETAYTDMSGDDDWPSFRADENNNGVTDIRTPVKAEDCYLNWAVSIGEGYSSGATGCPILVGDYLYTYAGTSIVKVDKRTGQILASGSMAASSSFAINSPTYANGMIFVGLSKGRIQAFRADTLESLWLYTDSLGGQPNCQITYKDGYIYTGFWNSETKQANFVCVSVTDEDTANTTEDKPASWTYTDNGFYWAGAYASDDFVLVTTDDGDSGYTTGYGSILSFDPLTGALIDRVQVSGTGDLRSSVCYDSVTNAYYFTSKGGDFYKIKVAEDGCFVKNSLQKLHLDNGSSNASAPPMSTSTPVIYNGRAYIGVSGTGQFTAYSGHNITVIDLNSWTIAYTVPTQGYPQTSGLLTTAYEGDTEYVYVYFFDNYTPGKLRVIRDKAGMTEPDPDYLTTETYTESGVEKTVQTAYCLFTPDGSQAQYAICSPIADAEGNIYFKNDSAQLMCLSPTVTSLEITKDPDRTSFCIGESFDPEGMEVKAHLSNGLTKDISDALSYTTEALTAEDTQITIEYDTDKYLLQNEDGTVSGHKAGYQNKDGEAGSVYYLPSTTLDISVEEHIDEDGHGRCDRCGQKLTDEILSLTGCSVKVEKETCIYTGEALKPGVTVTDTDGYKLKEGTDYTLAYSGNVEPGTASIEITGTGDYSGSLSASFIIKNGLARADISLAYEEAVYTGEALTPGVTVKDENGNLMTEGKDYTVSYSSNINAGTAKVTVSAAGEYTGSTSAVFTILPADISSCQASLKNSAYVYTGKNICPGVLVKDKKGNTLADGQDYDLQYQKNLNAGTAHAIVSGKGNYQGSLDLPFVISKAKQSLKVTAATKVTAGAKISVSVKGGQGTVSLVSSNKKIASVSKYTVTGVKTGTVSVTVKAAGNSNYLAASVKRTVNVLPKKTALSSVKSPKTRSLKISWKKNTTTDYYQIQYSLSKSFASAKTKTLLIKKNTQTSATVSKLKKKAVYYVRIRGLNGKKTLYSGWSSVKKIKIK